MLLVWAEAGVICFRYGHLDDDNDHFDDDNDNNNENNNNNNK